MVSVAEAEQVALEKLQVFHLLVLQHQSQLEQVVQEHLIVVLLDQMELTL
jgi:hypothetical protein